MSQKHKRSLNHFELAASRKATTRRDDAQSLRMRRVAQGRVRGRLKAASLSSVSPVAKPFFCRMYAVIAQS